MHAQLFMALRASKQAPALAPLPTTQQAPPSFPSYFRPHKRQRLRHSTSMDSISHSTNTNAENGQCHASRPISFFDLPRELRDMVYDELWKVTPRLQVARGHINRGTFEVHYGILPTFGVALRYGLPKWLRCDKRFLEEGICQLIRVGSWTCRWFPPVPDQTTSQQRLQSQGANSLLIDIPKITNITFVVNMINTVTDDGTEISLPPVRSQNSFSIRRFSPKIKDLTLQAYHDQLANGMLMIVHETTPWAVDLSWLDASVLLLDSITVRGTMWGRADLQPIAKGLQEAYKAELTRLGSLLVGQEGQIETEEAVTSLNEGSMVPPTHAYRLDFVVRFYKKPASVS